MAETEEITTSTIAGYTPNFFTDRTLEQLKAKGWTEDGLKAVKAELDNRGLSFAKEPSEPVHAFRKVDRRGVDTCQECGRKEEDSIHHAKLIIPPPGGDDVIPDGFPRKAQLEAGGVTTLSEVRERLAAGTLTEIEGIGEGYEKQIAEALGITIAE